jgi:FtsZ-interacting cell division protein YlmF
MDILDIMRKKLAPEEPVRNGRLLFRGGRVDWYDEEEYEEDAWDTPELYEVARSYAAAPKVLLCHPRSMADLPRIAEQMQDVFAILLNLEHLPLDLARRLLDTVSGIAYGMDYKMTRVSARSYLILPQSIELICKEPLKRP